MSLHDYWYEDPSWLSTYYQRYVDEEKERFKDRDWWCWFNGQYTMTAFNTALANAFSSKGSTPAEYLKEPLMAEAFLTEREKQRREEELRQQAVLEQEAKFKAMAARLGLTA